VQMGAQVPVLVLSVFIVYQIRKSVDGMADRCIKMVQISKAVLIIY
jgi:hypothetical protein